jgi:hypothetical protein
MPVAIAGMHRSGTSMVTRLLNLCGLYLGDEEDLFYIAKDNPEGFWENDKFLKINEEILTSFSAGWDVPPVLEGGWENSPHLTAISQKAKLYIKDISQQPLYGWKDPRNSLTLAFWKKLVPNLKVIICVRNPYEVYLSLAKRGYASSVFSYNLWLAYNQQLMDSTQPGERIFTHYDSFFQNPQAELRRLLGFLEMNVPDETIETACRTVSTHLRHNQSSIHEFYATNPSGKLLDLYREFCLRAGPVYGSALLSGENEFLQNIPPAEESEILYLKQDLPRMWQHLRVAHKENLKLQRELVQLHEAISRLKNEKELRISILQTRIEKLQYDLNDIHQSRSWRLVVFFQKIMLFFTPLNARQKSVKDDASRRTLPVQESHQNK